MRKSGNKRQMSISAERMVRCIGIALGGIVLNACLGCLQVLDLQVQNTGSSSITVLEVTEYSEKGIDKVETSAFGTVLPYSTVKFDRGLIDHGVEFILQIRDAKGTPIGEVRQLRSVVHTRMKDRIWTVKIPDDMTPLPAHIPPPAGQSAKIPSR